MWVRAILGQLGSCIVTAGFLSCPAYLFSPSWQPAHHSPKSTVFYSRLATHPIQCNFCYTFSLIHHTTTSCCINNVELWLPTCNFLPQYTFHCAIQLFRHWLTDFRHNTHMWLSWYMSPWTHSHTCFSLSYLKPNNVMQCTSTQPEWQYCTPPARMK